MKTKRKQTNFKADTRAGGRGSWSSRPGGGDAAPGTRGSSERPQSTAPRAEAGSGKGGDTQALPAHPGAAGPMSEVSRSSGSQETTQGRGLDEAVPAVGDPGREAAPQLDGGANATAGARAQARGRPREVRPPAARAQGGEGRAGSAGSWGSLGLMTRGVARPAQEQQGPG